VTIPLGIKGSSLPPRFIDLACKYLKKYNELLKLYLKKK